MPEMHFSLLWPDGTRERCYSPSLVIRDHLEVGRSYGLGDFVGRAREALGVASARVEERYGFPCSRALGQIRAIEAAAARQPGGEVLVEGFEP